MKFEETSLKGAQIIELEPIKDDRGFFARAFCSREFQSRGLSRNFVQANLTFSPRKGTLRGIHYQVEPFQEAKFIRCIAGAIYDVIVDLRRDSPTFLKWLGFNLTSTNRTMLYVPEGLGHGYLTLADNTEVFYQVSQFYEPKSERGLRWNDPLFQIRWPTEPTVVSDKDSSHPDFVP
jgi:dTDP-4-dehydrorhamnose 3,5-epimerase